MPFLNPLAIKSRDQQMFLANASGGRCWLRTEACHDHRNRPRGLLAGMLCFISASLIGRTGNAVLSRVLGMLLAAYSVQFVINGIAAVRASFS
jgi:hypothetical protein